MDRAVTYHERDDDPDSSTPVRRRFNPMITYIQMILLLVAGYGVLGAFGYSALVAVMLVAVILHFRNTFEVLATLPYNFTRWVAYFNVVHVTVFFTILIINSYGIVHLGGPVILPEVPTLTLLCPLFIAAGLFGTVNVMKMYEPPEE